MIKDKQYFKFCAYGFLKNLRFFDAFFILFLIEKGLNYTEIGMLYAVREIFTNIFEIPSGIIADTYGRKNSLIASFIAYIISFYVFYSATDFWWFLFAFIVYGIGEAFRSGTHKGMIMDYLRLNKWSQHKINYYGHTRSWSQKGSAISSLIAGTIVFYSGSFQTVFLYSIIPYLINLGLIVSYPQEINKSSEINSSKKHLGMTSKSLFKTLKQANVLKIINTSAVHTAYLRVIKDYIQPIMVNIALVMPFMLDTATQKKNGIVIGVLYFFIYLATSRASRLSVKVYENDKLNISRKTLITGFALGIFTGVFYVYNLWVLALITFVGIYIIENIRKPILTGIISDNVPNELLTSVISAQSLLRTVISALLAIVFGVLADNFGIGISLLVVSLFLFITTLLIKTKIGN